MKTDLRYFQQSTSTFLDRTIRRLIIKHQANGFLIYQYLKCEIFRENGYYIVYDEFLTEDIASWFTFIEKKEIERIILYCIEIELFDAKVFETNKVLTSKSIQENYFEISRRMKRKIQSNDFWIIQDDRKESQGRNNNETEEVNGDFSRHTSEDSGKFQKSSGTFQKIQDDFGNDSGIFPNTSREFAVNKGKEIKEIKERNKEISLSLNRERLQEIFLIEKNYPAIEFEKFLNHYQKTGWVDKNGNRVKDPIAAARNWIQLSGQVKFYVKPEIHQKWKKVWEDYKESLGFDKASHLLNVRPIISGNEVVFVCSIEDREICEKNIEILKPILRTVFGETIKLNYRILVPDLV